MSINSHKILVVEDDDEEREIIASALIKAGYEIVSSSCAEEAYSLISKISYDIVVLDLLLGDDFEAAFDLVDQIKKFSPITKVIILSAHGTAEYAVRAVKAGAFDFVDKPLMYPYKPQDISKILLPKIKKALCSDDYAKIPERKKLLQRFSENQLIDKILIPLLKQMGYLGVQRNAFHGPGEHGKDILPFYKYGDFNERIYYAAQVKAGKISARSGVNSNVHTLLDQVRSVLVFSFIDKFDGCRKKIDRCLVVCSGDITNDARKVLEEASEGRRDIIIIEADDLLDLLRRWNLLQYFDRIAKRK
jgi:CheY-like chemotaxis protein